MIQIKRTLECLNDWTPEMQSVIFVKNKQDKDKLFELLVDQDSYWKTYKHLIQITPKVIEREQDLQKYCGYCGSTDIWSTKTLKESVDFTIYQYTEIYNINC